MRETVMLDDAELDAIRTRIANCRTYNFGMRDADLLAHEDAAALLRDLRAARQQRALPVQDDDDTEPTATEWRETIHAERARQIEKGYTPEHDRQGGRKDAPGAFRKVTGFPESAVAYPSNLTGTYWLVMTPNGLHGALGAHTVREEDDGSITVAPGDGSSNSILVSNGAESWHGYITKGLWWELT